MKEYPNLRKRDNIPVSKEDIEKYEQDNDVTFPKSYKEFLSLGGNGANVLASMSHHLQFAKERQDYTKQLLKEESLSVGEDFWVIADLDGGEQFHFFYFNDPEALEVENPPVYLASPGYQDEGVPLKKKLADTFQEYIEKKIRGYAGLE